MTEQEVLRNPIIAYDALGPEGDGFLQINRFIGGRSLEALQQEAADPTRVLFEDAHDEYVNARGLTVIQNHEVYALKLGLGDQMPFQQMPQTVLATACVNGFVQDLWTVFPSLGNWEADEVSLHRYYDQKLGLSFHRDNLRYLGVIAILSVDGECDMLIRKDENDTDVRRHPAEPGDLILLRGSQLVDETSDLLCPDHSVVELRTPTRTSLMLRHNARPEEVIDGFKFNNWPVTT